jgi:leader peptidase (prepilin peptidase)/N-methyltransferase
MIGAIDRWALTLESCYSTYFLVAALGLSVGSFANVLICRLPQGQSILRPRSRCPSCGNSLRWYHNIPVVSWLVLRARCGFCKEPISWIYPAVEILVAALFVGFYARFGVSVTTLGFWYLGAVLIAVLFIDWEHRIIPNSLTYPTVIVGFVVALIAPHITIVQSLLGAAVGFGGFMAIGYLGNILFKRDSLGGGDIKLAAGLGAFLGIWKVLLVFVLSAAVGLVISLAVMAFSPALRKDRVIPFGPFLAIAALIAGFWGDTLLQFYLQYFVQ